MSEEIFDYEARLDLIPHKPGCYIMRDRRDRIVYVGKAKDLKNRVKSYFAASSGDTRAFVQRLPKILSDIETIVTATEKDALVLENTLIKAHQPRYNVLLKDDKNFISLRINVKGEWPRVEVVRRQAKDGARYFGPYTDARSIRQTLSLLNKYFQLRTCTDAALTSRTRPCLQYQIKRCPGPCVFAVDTELYDRHVRDAVLFLEGRGDELVNRLKEKMYEASEDMEFERAANYRDQILSVSKALDRQSSVSVEIIDRDVFGYHREGDRLTVQVMYVRGGKLEGVKAFSYKGQEFPDQELMSSFLNLYYASGSFVPKEVLVPIAFDEEEFSAFEELLADMKGQKVAVYSPQRGAKSCSWIPPTKTPEFRSKKNTTRTNELRTCLKICRTALA